jgi:spoIIIJ-associated protein
MSYIEVTGKTEEEAVRKALTQLGLERDDVSLEILERAKSGFLGIGGSPARIRVTYGTDEPEEKKAEPTKKVEKKPEPKAEVKKPEVRPEPKKQEPKKPETKPVEKAPEQKTVTVGTCDDDNARRIREFLEGLLQHMNSPAQVNVALEEKGRYQVTLEGEKLGQLIGRRGETLDAIQQLTNYAVNSGADKRIRVHVDAENYRAKREQSLESLARKVAGKVTKYRRSVTLEPMNAYERHVIHAALQDEPGITTYSIGSAEPPCGGELRPGEAPVRQRCSIGNIPPPLHRGGGVFAFGRGDPNGRCIIFSIRQKAIRRRHQVKTKKEFPMHCMGNSLYTELADPSRRITGSSPRRPPWPGSPSWHPCETGSSGPSRRSP